VLQLVSKSFHTHHLTFKVQEFFAALCRGIFICFPLCLKAHLLLRVNTQTFGFESGTSNELEWSEFA